MRQIILDTETTGLSTVQGDRVIEIGAIEMIDRKLTNRHFHFYLNPDRIVHEDALKIHGISNEFLMDKPRFFDIADPLMDFLRGAELIIHNAEFDINFLNYELSMLRRNSYGCITEHCSVFDTLVLARQLHPGQRNSLDALCKRYSINNSHRKYHGALLDAEILAHLYLAMTGGQEVLFDSQYETPETQAQKIKKSIRPQTQLRVIQPSSLEKEAHIHYFQKK